jgi:hypothetical protein
MPRGRPRKNVVETEQAGDPGAVAVAEPPMKYTLIEAIKDLCDFMATQRIGKHSDPLDRAYYSLMSAINALRQVNENELETMPADIEQRIKFITKTDSERGR